MGNKKTSKQTVSKSSKPVINSSKPKGINWTEILSKNNLEAPGYHETVESMKKRW